MRSIEAGEERTSAMTQLRVQPLAASTAMLAAEHERLDRAKTKLEKEIAAMTATQTPSGDDLVRALAAEIRSEEARTASKREALARAEAAMRTQARDAEAENERRWQTECARLFEQLRADEEARILACDIAERGFRAAVQNLNNFLAANAKVRATANALTGHRAMERKVGTGSLSDAELMSRLGRRIAGLLQQIKPPGAPANVPTHRLGGLALAYATPASESWTERERAFGEPLVAALTGTEG
jgi:hypothetical protein